MSFSVDQWFIKAYGRAVDTLAQQQGSRLRNTVDVDSDVVGTRKFYDQIGITTAQTPTSRHADSPLISTPHTKRVLDLVEKEVGDLIDDFDMVKTLNDPTNDYVRLFGYALGRSIDSEIIRAARATSVTGPDGLGTATYPAGQTIAAGGTGLTFDKLNQARALLRASEAIMDGESITCVTSSEGIQSLLTESVVQSIDTNTVRALVNGEVTTFMGFTFVQTELIDGLGTATARTLVYPRSAIKLGIGKEITHEIDPKRSDKRFSTYVYSCMRIGANAYAGREGCDDHSR